MTDDARATAGALPWMGADGERVGRALLAPEGDPDRAEAFRYLGRVAATMAAEMWGDPMWGAGPPDRSMRLKVIAATTRGNFRGVAEQLGAGVEQREAISEAATLGFLKFKQALRRAEADGPADREATAGRVLVLLEAHYGRA